MFRYRMFGAAIAVLSIAATVQAQETDLKKFAGPWSVTAARLGDQDAKELVGAAFLFEGNVAKFTQAGPDGKPVTDVHPIKMQSETNRIVLYQQQDPKDPKADPTSGMQRGIYAFKESVLYLCLTAPDAKEFPTKFVSKVDDSDFLLLKLERPKTAQTTGATTR